MADTVIEALSYKTYVLRFIRESRFSFNQQIARSLSKKRSGRMC